MTKENFAKVLASFLKRKPFEPFTLELVTGSRVEVNHPEALDLRRELIVCKSTRGTYGVFEYSAVIRFIDTTGIT